jgi:hypothetical protein
MYINIRLWTRWVIGKEMGKEEWKYNLFFLLKQRLHFPILKDLCCLHICFFKANINDFSHVDLEIHYQNGVFLGQIHVNMVFASFSTIVRTCFHLIMLKCCFFYTSIMLLFKLLKEHRGSRSINCKNLFSRFGLSSPSFTPN